MEKIDNKVEQNTNSQFLLIIIGLIITFGSQALYYLEERQERLKDTQPNVSEINGFRDILNMFDPEQ